MTPESERDGAGYRDPQVTMVETAPFERCQERMFAFSRRCPRPADGPIPGYCDLHSQCRVRSCDRPRVPASGDRLCEVHHRRRTILRRVLVGSIVVLIPWSLFVGARFSTYDKNPCAIGATSYGIFGPNCAVTNGELNAADRFARREIYQDYSAAFDAALDSGLSRCQGEASTVGDPGENAYEQAFDTCWADAKQVLYDLTDTYNADVEAAGQAARAALYEERTGKPWPYD